MPNAHIGLLTYLLTDLLTFCQPTEKTKLETLIAKSVKSAADFNASLMRELRQERRAYFDLQTSVSNSSYMCSYCV